MSAATEMSVMSKIEIDGPQPMIIDPADAKRRPVLNAEEARTLTTEIQRTTASLWLLVTEAHDRAAHFALGYETWDDYARAELKMSPSRSYQLLDTGHVMRAMATAGVDIGATKVPTARTVAKVKDRLTEVRRVARKAVKEGMVPDDALRQLAKQPKAVTAKPTGKRKSGRPPVMVSCPACHGDGVVTRSIAGKVRRFMKK